DLTGQIVQFVGAVTHRGDDHDHRVARLPGDHDALGYPLDAVGVGDRRPTVLLHDERHLRRSSRWGTLAGLSVPTSAGGGLFVALILRWPLRRPSAGGGLSGGPQPGVASPAALSRGWPLRRARPGRGRLGRAR